MVTHNGFWWSAPMDRLRGDASRLIDLLTYVPREPRIFPSFYEKLLTVAPEPLTSAPLRRFEELGEPLAHGGEIVELPVSTNIVHCCDPQHLAGTHILTVPFFVFDGAHSPAVNRRSGEGSYKISLRRGVELFPGVGLFPFAKEVTMYLRGPLCFELDTGDLIIMFQLTPLQEDRHLMEVSLFSVNESSRGAEHELLKPILPKIGEFFVRISMAEDSHYLAKIDASAVAAITEEVDSFGGNLPGLIAYRELYGSSLPGLLSAAYPIAQGLVR